MTQIEPSIALQNKLLVYLAQRDHSEKELLVKLKKNFEIEEVEQGVKWARDKGWILPPEELAQKIYVQLSQRLKGLMYINLYLANKGLPSVEGDSDLERQKALDFLQKKYSPHLFADFKMKQKALLSLKNRGFAYDVCQWSIKEFLIEDDD